MLLPLVAGCWVPENTLVLGAAGAKLAVGVVPVDPPPNMVGDVTEVPPKIDPPNPPEPPIQKKKLW